jgi:hypothetical protein
VEYIISSFRGRQARNQQKLRAITASLGFSLHLLFDLEDGAVCSSETSVFFQITRRYKLEDLALHSHTLKQQNLNNKNELKNPDIGWKI